MESKTLCELIVNKDASDAERYAALKCVVFFAFLCFVLPWFGV